MYFFVFIYVSITRMIFIDASIHSTRIYPVTTEDSPSSSLTQSCVILNSIFFLETLSPSSVRSPSAETVS